MDSKAFARFAPLRDAWRTGSGIAALVIAWLTMSVQALKAANLDPVKCLRSE